MAKRKRNIQILFCVSPEEKKLIRRKMIESKTKNMGAYLRKMAIDGYIVNTDTKRQISLFFQLLIQIANDLISRCLFYLQKFTYIGCL